MIQDVEDLMRGEARVYRDKHRATQRNSKMSSQQRLAVHRKECHTIAWLNPEGLQTAAHAADLFMKFAVSQQPVMIHNRGRGGKHTSAPLQKRNWGKRLMIRSHASRVIVSQTRNLPNRDRTTSNWRSSLLFEDMSAQVSFHEVVKRCIQSGPQIDVVMERGVILKRAIPVLAKSGCCAIFS